jgi:pre-mRNA-processing factor SLU7
MSLELLSEMMLWDVQAVLSASTAVWGSEHAEDVELDEDKLKAALKKQDALNRAAVQTDDRKRKFNSLAGAQEEVTPEEMEAYRMTRTRADDPMAAFLSADSDE